MYCQIDRRSVHILLIDDEAALSRYSNFWQQAYVCGLDAEWQPSAQRPSATTIQLAVKRHSQDEVTTVLLLDVLALPKAALKAFLQELFRAKTVLKVGYGLANDLKAVGIALGAHGGSCIAVVQPFVDIQTLVKQMRKHCPNYIPKSKGPGLAGLAEGVFGFPMDKSLQCSAWEERPLSAAQVEYAALDAACLLSFLEVFITRCPPKLLLEGIKLPLNLEEEEDPNAEVAEESSAVLDGVQRETANCDRPTATECLPKSSSFFVSGCGLKADSVLEASEAWGCRLEISGSAIYSTSCKAWAHLHSTEQSDIWEDFPPGLPRIPWKSGHAAKFVADLPQEGLARQLRLCGFDVKSAPSASKVQRNQVYRFLVETAETEGRVILTCDRLFVMRRLTELAFLVTGANKKAQLAEVLEAFGLTVDHSDLLSRCAKCNGTFIPRPMRYSELPEGSNRRIPAPVVQMHDTKFWVCASCLQVYWRGSQFTRCLDDLSARLKGSPALKFA